MVEKARGFLNEGWHCSEGILLAVGTHYLGEVDPQVLRQFTVFAGSFMEVLGNTPSPLKMPIN